MTLTILSQNGFTSNFTASFAAIFVAIVRLSLWVSIVGITSSLAMGFQDPSNPTNNNQPAINGTLISTYSDIYGQPYGRYIINETVPELVYEMQPVKEKRQIPRSVTENRLITKVQYRPVYSYQPQLRNVPSWNPFATPQQVWENVLVVYQQPEYIQVNEPVTFQRYEEQDVTLNIPVLKSISKQVTRTVDRPLGSVANTGNVIANASPANNILNPNYNMVQQSALIAQNNRNQSRFPSRPINYPYAGYPQPNYLATAPAPYYSYPNPNVPAVSGPTGNSPMQYAPMVAVNPTSPTGTNVFPSTPLKPIYTGAPNTMAGYPPYPPGSNPAYSYSAMPNGVNPYGAPNYASTASRPAFSWPSIASSRGTLFNKSLFGNSPNPNYLASNTQVSQPYLWGNSNAGVGYNSGTAFSGLRPNSNPYLTPQPSWGMSPGNIYRDPVQGGMPATVLR